MVQYWRDVFQNEGQFMFPKKIPCIFKILA